MLREARQRTHPKLFFRWVPLVLEAVVDMRYKVHITMTTTSKYHTFGWLYAAHSSWNGLIAKRGERRISSIVTTALLKLESHKNLAQVHIQSGSHFQLRCAACPAMSLPSRTWFSCFLWSTPRGFKLCEALLENALLCGQHCAFLTTKYECGALSLGDC